MIVLFIDFLGYFHPVLVHLPIGILLLAGLFQFMSRSEKYKSLKPAIGISLFWGMLGAIASCITGFILSRSGDYDGDLISTHQRFGITVAIVTIVAYSLNKKNNPAAQWSIALMVLLVIITGHLGGSITHGSDYLTKNFSLKKDEVANKRKPVANMQEALLYHEVVQPILESNCYGCHGPNKQKSKLRLDDPDFIMKGGKNGTIIFAGNVDKSKMIERLLLPLSDEDHMPPKEKPQLSKNDIEVLKWWVENGADFHKQVKDFPQPDRIKPVLLAMQSGEQKSAVSPTSIPLTNVNAGDKNAIEKLKERGVSIFSVAQNSNYLSATFVAVDGITQSDLNLLEQLRDQLIWLKLGDTKINDEQLKTIAKLTALTKLYLERTGITDNGLQHLKALSQLQYLNVIGTNISIKGIGQLKQLKKLDQLYVFQSGITGNDFRKMQSMFPTALIDNGSASMAFLQSDTVVINEPIFVP